MNAHAEAHAEGHGSSRRTNLVVWFWLLGLTIVEVVLAYVQVPFLLMLVTLLGLSLVKSVLIVAFFMHLKFERLSFVLTLIPAMVMTICLLFVFYPDGSRTFDFRMKYPVPPNPKKTLEEVK